MPDAKAPWRGTLLGVQPRIRLTRSFDQRHHSYLGFVLFLRGAAAGEAREFSVGIGSAAQAKHGFRAGDEVSGEAVAAQHPETEPAQFYKASALRVLARGAQAGVSPRLSTGALPRLDRQGFQLPGQSPGNGFDLGAGLDGGGTGDAGDEILAEFLRIQQVRIGFD